MLSEVEEHFSSIGVKTFRCQRMGYADFFGQGVEQQSSAMEGVILVQQREVPARGSITFWIKLPYELPEAEEKTLTADDGPTLLTSARQGWEKLWSQGTQIELPSREKELSDLSARLRGEIVEKINKTLAERASQSGYQVVIDSSGSSLNGVPVALRVGGGVPDLTQEIVLALGGAKD